jgi:UvrD-like helicase C-terminal domain/Dolichyl-phosphate-mannose-protein mannosyltransferase
MDLRSSWARQLVALRRVALRLRAPDGHHGVDVGDASTLPEESDAQRANYRSTQNILAAANAVVSRNGSRAPDRLWSDAGDGPPIVGYVADNEQDEAAFVAEEVDRLTDESEATPGQVAVFYRTNAQSRVFEDVFIRAGLPYKVVGGTRFYERREVRDLLAYLRLIANPEDEVSLRRILNVPRRGIGDRAEACVAAIAQRDKQSFAAALACPAEVPGLAAKSVRSIEAFNELIDGLRADDAAGMPVADLAEAVLERSGYLAELQTSEDLRDASRIENLNELISVAREFDAGGGAAGRRDPEDPAGAAPAGAAPEGTLADFLEQVSLVVDADQVPEWEDHGGVVSLMTLRTAKGRKFPVVFLTGLEENVFPHQASVGDDKELEEERRLAYVGITRAERCLYLTRALARTWWGRPEYHAQSRFLAEVPESLIEWRRDQNAAAAAAPASQRQAQRPGARSPGTSTRPGVAPPAALNVSRSRLGSVIAIVGAGLLMVGVGDALGRTSHQSPVVPLFLAGLTFIFAPCAWRLTGTAATRTERVWVSVILGLGLLASYVFRSPLIFDNFDELNHGATLTRLIDSRALFQPNPILPVCPFYPGIELVTIATRWLTGLPLLLDQMVVLVLARVVTVLCVFLIVERACHSSRAGGIGALVYAANPEFYSLGAQYGYQTLALAFAVAVVYLLFVAIDTSQPKRGGLFALALISIAGMVVSHHVTAWLTIGFLVVWAAGLRFIIDSPGQPAATATAGQIPASKDLARSHAGIASRDEQSARRKKQSRIVGLAALVGVVLAGVWIAFIGHVITGYIDPIIQEAASSTASMLGHLHGKRQLFQNSAGGGTPFWVTALVLASAVFFCLIILISLYAVIWKKSVRGGRLRYLPAAIAATYPLAMLTNLSDAAKEVGSRATTFIFFGVAVVVGGWLAGRLLTQRRVIERMATMGVAIICFLGSTLYGGGPLPILVNGPYIVGAHERSVGSPSLALANWVSTHLPKGSHVAADRDNSGLLNAFGQVYPLSPLSGSYSPARLFFDKQLTPSDISLIRKDHIRYIVTDTRLTAGLPLFGAYIVPGESVRPTRLTAAELEKFNSIRGVHRIYDNGAIQVYDLSQLLGERPFAVPRDSVRSIRATGTDVAVLVLAILVAIVWLWRLRRRARLVPIDAHMVVCGMVGALAIGLFGPFAILFIHLPPGPIAILSLLALLALGLWPAGLRRHPERNVHRWAAASPPVPLESAAEPQQKATPTPASQAGEEGEPSPAPSALRAGQDDWLEAQLAWIAAWSRQMNQQIRSAGMASVATNFAGTGVTSSDPVLESRGQPPRRTRRARSQFVLGCAGLALVAVGASFAVAAAQKEWVPPPELSIEVRQGEPVASVDLGTAAPISAHVAVVTRGRVLWSVPLSSKSGTQNVVLPADVVHPGSHVLLVAGGRTIRNVYG